MSDSKKYFYSPPSAAHKPSSPDHVIPHCTSAVVSDPIADLTADTIQYAKDIHGTVRAQRAADNNIDRPASTVRFHAASNSASTSNNNLSDDESVDSAASFSKHLDSGSRQLFNTPKLRPNQQATVKQIVLDQLSDGKLLVVKRAGGKKREEPHVLHDCCLGCLLAEGVVCQPSHVVIPCDAIEQPLSGCSSECVSEESECTFCRPPNATREVRYVLYQYPVGDLFKI
mmetsp:Transcript_43134/g.73562  ORF Transcript_43134/g.73562 Transcript_43134/m.73562 type:complete len:228 (+) Transcript_43134:235-918(+)